jgi:hypothetical protein
VRREPSLCLIAQVGTRKDRPEDVRISEITEDCVQIARRQGWVVFARESDFAEPSTVSDEGDGA